VTVRRVIMVGAVLALLAFVSAARASLIASDSFGYPAAAGGLAGQNGGPGWTSDWGTGTNNVVSPGLTYSKNGVSLVTSGNSSETVGGNIGNFRSLPSTFSSGTVYVSFLGKLDNANGTIGSSYAGVSLFNAGSENLFIGQATGLADWGVDQATGAKQSSTPVDGTTHLFVIQIDYGAATDNSGEDRVRMYVDPTPGETAPDVSASIDANTTRSASFDQVRIQSGGPQIAFDELRISTDYASAVPVPEPAQAAFLGLAGLGLFSRRRRRT